MTKRDIARILHVLDSLDAPPWDATRVRIEAILVERRIAAERAERERPKAKLN